MTATEAIPQGDLRLLDIELAQQVLDSTIPARLADVAHDGTPTRVGLLDLAERLPSPLGGVQEVAS